MQHTGPKAKDYSNKLWKIEPKNKTEPVRYLFATVHFVQASQDELLKIPGFKDALQQANTVFTELNYTNPPKPQFSEKKILNVEKNPNLEKTLEFLAGHLKTDKKSLEFLTPESFLELTGYFSSLELDNLDKNISLLAQKNNKNTNQLETYPQVFWKTLDLRKENEHDLRQFNFKKEKHQIEFLNSMWDDKYASMFKNKVQSSGDPEEDKKLSQMYLKGENADFWNQVVDLEEGSYRDYIDARDKVFFEAIKNDLKQDHSSLYSVGLHHLPGLIYYFEKSGYTVKPVTASKEESLLASQSVFSHANKQPTEQTAEEKKQEIEEKKSGPHSP